MKALSMRPHQPNDRMQEWREELTLAFAFLTRLPVQTAEQWEPARLTHALRLAPAVGAFAGAFGGSFYWLVLSFGFSTLIAAVIGITAAAILTGGLHEDALSDMADGFSGGWNRERKLEIMSDARIGAHGALALILVLLLRIGTMAQLGSPARVMAAMIAAGALSRAVMYVAMAILPHAKQSGLGQAAGRPGGPQALCALALGCAIVWLALPLGTALAALIAACLGGLLIGGLARRQIGGQTGDILGAIQQISELGVMLIMATLLTS